MKVASGNVLWQQRKRNWCRTPFTFTVYTLTDRELSVKTGILNESFNLIKLFRIVDISVERTFLQRIFGMSTIVLPGSKLSLLSLKFPVNPIRGA